MMVFIESSDLKALFCPELMFAAILIAIGGPCEEIFELIHQRVEIQYTLSKFSTLHEINETMNAPHVAESLHPKMELN